eukprot:m.265224 g.265224  ORF g.265224 m.265224 type:complete len:696 (-) comp16235_c1_seq6:130-2217(-)
MAMLFQISLLLSNIIPSNQCTIKINNQPTNCDCTEAVNALHGGHGLTCDGPDCRRAYDLAEQLAYHQIWCSDTSFVDTDEIPINTNIKCNNKDLKEYDYHLRASPANCSDSCVLRVYSSFANSECSDKYVYDCVCTRSCTTQNWVCAGKACPLAYLKGNYLFVLDYGDMRDGCAPADFLTEKGFRPDPWTTPTPDRFAWVEHSGLLKYMKQDGICDVKVGNSVTSCSCSYAFNSDAKWYMKCKEGCRDVYDKAEQYIWTHNLACNAKNETRFQFPLASPSIDEPITCDFLEFKDAFHLSPKVSFCGDECMFRMYSHSTTPWTCPDSVKQVYNCTCSKACGTDKWECGGSGCEQALRPSTDELFFWDLGQFRKDACGLPKDMYYRYTQGSWTTADDIHVVYLVKENISKYIETTSSTATQTTSSLTATTITTTLTTTTLTSSTDTTVTGTDTTTLTTRTKISINSGTAIQDLSTKSDFSSPTTHIDTTADIDTTANIDTRTQPTATGISSSHSPTSTHDSTISQSSFVDSSSDDGDASSSSSSAIIGGVVGGILLCLLLVAALVLLRRNKEKDVKTEAPGFVMNRTYDTTKAQGFNPSSEYDALDRTLNPKTQSNLNPQVLYADASNIDDENTYSVAVHDKTATSKNSVDTYAVAVHQNPRGHDQVMYASLDLTTGEKSKEPVYDLGSPTFKEKSK